MHHSVRDPADCTMTFTNQKATLEEVCDACGFSFVATRPVHFRRRLYHIVPCFTNVTKEAVATLVTLLRAEGDK